MVLYFQPSLWDFYGASGSGKTNSLLNVIKHQRPDFDKIYLSIKDPFKSKYQLIINRRKTLRIKGKEIPKGLLTKN